MNDCKEVGAHQIFDRLLKEGRDVNFETMSCPILFSLFIILVH